MLCQLLCPWYLWKSFSCYPQEVPLLNHLVQAQIAFSRIGSRRSQRAYCCRIGIVRTKSGLKKCLRKNRSELFFFLTCGLIQVCKHHIGWVGNFQRTWSLFMAARKINWNMGKVNLKGHFGIVTWALLQPNHCGATNVPAHIFCF